VGRLSTLKTTEARMAKIIGYLKNQKIVRKAETRDSAAHDILEFKVESLDVKAYDRLKALEAGQLIITIESRQQSLDLGDGVTVSLKGGKQ
jgi:hypothetical protein